MPPAISNLQCTWWCFGPPVVRTSFWRELKLRTPSNVTNALFSGDCQPSHRHSRTCSLSFYIKGITLVSHKKQQLPPTRSVTSYSAMQHFIPLIAALWIGTDVSAFTSPLYHVRRIPIAMNAANGHISRREILSVASAGAFMLASSQPASARLEGVNRPDLLPSESGLNVIQVEKFLTTGQAKRMNDLLTALERDTGFRVRVLCQAYPNTPGLAIRDYWDLGKEVRETK